MTQSEHTPEILTPDRWLELVEIGESSDLVQVLREQHAADIAALIDQVPADLKDHIFGLLGDLVAAEVLAEIDGLTQVRLVESLPIDKTARITSVLASDDAADMLSQLDVEKTESVLSILPEEKRNELIELLTYDEESAGGIMAKEALSVLATTSVKEVIEQLRASSPTIEEVYNVYIVDDDRHPIGYVTLKDLILAHPTQGVGEIMNREVQLVNVNQDREIVAGLFQRYDLASAPVIDDNGRFLGRITHDDILDVIADEAEEDIAHLSGQTEIDPGERSIIRNMNYRLPWLLLGLLGGLAAATVIAHFKDKFSDFISLIFFLPLVAAMGGNAGIQTSSLMVRGLATGEIGSYGLVARLFRELAIAILTGLICGIALFGITYLWQGNLSFALVVSSALLIVIVFAAIVGAVVPLVLKAIGLDPALATGPFITTTNDIFGLFIYLGIAGLILS